LFQFRRLINHFSRLLGCGLFVGLCLRFWALVGLFVPSHAWRGLEWFDRHVDGDRDCVFGRAFHPFDLHAADREDFAHQCAGVVLELVGEQFFGELVVGHARGGLADVCPYHAAQDGERASCAARARDDERLEADEDVVFCFDDEAVFEFVAVASHEAFERCGEDAVAEEFGVGFVCFDVDDLEVDVDGLFLGVVGERHEADGDIAAFDGGGVGDVRFADFGFVEQFGCEYWDPAFLDDGRGFWHRVRWEGNAFLKLATTWGWVVDGRTRPGAPDTISRLPQPTYHHGHP